MPVVYATAASEEVRSESLFARARLTANFLRLLLFVGTYRTDTPEPAFHGYVIAGSMFVCAVTQTVRPLS